MMRFHREAVVPRLITLSGVSVLLGVALAAGAAAAKEIKYPESDPRITLQVPDAWAVASDEHGLVLTSPEKDAHVLVGVVAGNEKAVEAWAKDARAKLVAAGTTFDKSKPTRTLVAKAAPNQLAIAPNTFSGAPTIGQNFGSAAGTSATPVPAPAPAPPPATTPFKVIQTAGSKLNDKPVDMEISFYKIGTDDILVMEQQSGPIDERGVDIEHSVKILK